MHDMNEELPHDLLLSISRILDLRESPEADPLDTVGGRFDVVDIINHYFPNGASVLEAMPTKLPKPPCGYLRGITWAARCSTSAASAR